MTWTTPLTAVSNTALTAAQWNASVRDDLLETGVAKATTAGGYFVATGSKAVAQRTGSEVEVTTADTTTSTSYVTTLDGASTGPSITATTGPQALSVIASDIGNTTASQSGRVSIAISGASSVAAADNRALRHTVSAAGVNARTSLTSMLAVTAGSNTFAASYRASGGTAQFANRRLAILPY